jgi:polysaccharide export outer membrane protein
MLKGKTFPVMIIFLLSLPCFVQGREYVLGPNDLLKITVYDHKDLETRARVSENGIITFPLLGEIQAASLTIQQLEQRITALLADGYIVKPHVSVFVEEFRVVIYVTGEVSKPGSYPFQEGMTILKAVALAGGFTDKAAPGRTKIIRKGTDGREVTIRARMEDSLQPEDVVVVAESFF